MTAKRIFSDSDDSARSAESVATGVKKADKGNTGFHSMPAGKPGVGSDKIISNANRSSIDEQLKKMLLLEDGWLDGNGLTPSSQGLNWLAGLFALYYNKDNLPPPHLYPAEEGNMQVEWRLGAREITIEIDLKSHSGFWHEMNFDTGSEHECILDIDSEHSWSWMIKRIEDAA